MAYEPREDSFLILKHIKDYLKSNPNLRVLELGTGTAILAKEAAKYAKEVIAVDIDKKLTDRLKKQNDCKNIKFIHSDLFSNINTDDKNKFDLILFNPPYLPSKKIKDKTVDGGKQGLEVTNKFLKQAKKYLRKEGKILLIVSSLNKDIESLFKKYHYIYKKLDQKSFFFEKIYLYELSI